jgi:hypothetical protein
MKNENQTALGTVHITHRGSWVAYFVASFCFESMSLAESMIDFKVKTRGKRSSQESIFMIELFLRIGY